MHIPQDRVDAPLYVIAPVFNPERFKRRWKLYRDFQAHVRASGAILVTIEASFGKRQHAVEEHAIGDQPEFTAPVPADATWLPPSRSGQDYLKVQTDDIFWLKENLINRAMRHLPPDWKYVAWVDADILFARPDWVSETKHRLQRAPFVQMFSEAIDLGPEYEVMQRHKSFMWCWSHGITMPQAPFYPYYQGGGEVKGVASHWHPGFAWAARRDGIDCVGGLIDWGILGAGDMHMARALVGQVKDSIPSGLHRHYKEMLYQWEDRFQRRFHRLVDYVPGTILHYWHGRKADRRYHSRWRILVDHRFDPRADLRTDWQGLYTLDERRAGLRDAIRRYFQQRNEDGIDV